MILGLCAYCGTGFSETEKRCSYCGAPLPETGGHILIASSSPLQAKQGDKPQDASLGLAKSGISTCRRKKRGFFSLLFDRSLLEYVIS